MWSVLWRWSGLYGAYTLCWLDVLIPSILLYICLYTIYRQKYILQISLASVFSFKYELCRKLVWQLSAKNVMYIYAPEEWKWLSSFTYLASLGRLDSHIITRAYLSDVDQCLLIVGLLSVNHIQARCLINYNFLLKMISWARYLFLGMLHWKIIRQASSSI